MILRPYQSTLESDIYSAWGAGATNVMAVLPTGGGKTPIEAKLADDHGRGVCVMAHRQELVGQISLMLAGNGVPHRIEAQQPFQNEIIRQHVLEYKRNFVVPKARIVVAGVDTLLRRNDPWMEQTTLWILDEGHHLQRDNKWGKVVRKFPHAKGVAFTATAERPSGEGLGRDTDGLIDKLVIGPCGRELIDAGYLSDYIIHCPEPSYDTSDIPISRATGDFNERALSIRASGSTIVGDVVGAYLLFAPGKLGLTFATDISAAEDITQEYNARGVPAELITAKTHIQERMSIMRRFRAREILQLVNVDIAGEGFDVPALEVVSFARATASRNLYVQQFGRVMRILEGKLYGIIIDHVGNFLRHKFPDTPYAYTLARREKRAKVDPDVIVTKICLNPTCSRPYKAVYPKCPYCQHKPEPAVRTSPVHVDGNLLKLDLAALAELRAARDVIDTPFDPMYFRNAPRVAMLAGRKRHTAAVEAQAELRESIALWAGWQRHYGKNDAESYQRFYHTYKIDVLSAQALKPKDATELNERIRRNIP